MFGVLVYLARVTFSLRRLENSELTDSSFHGFQENPGMRSRVGLMIAVMFLIMLQAVITVRLIQVYTVRHFQDVMKGVTYHSE